MTSSETARRVDLPGTIESLTILNTMGKRIAYSRLRREMTQLALAKSLDKSRATIVQYEQDNIMPPIDVVERMAKILHTSPEFIAFGRQGVDGLKDGNQIVPVSEMVMGTSAEYAATGYALPTKLLEDFQISDNKLKIFVLTDDCPYFKLKTGDRVVVATDVQKSDRHHTMFLCRTLDGYDVIQFDRKYNVEADTTTFVNGDGKVHSEPIEKLNLAGAITATIVRV